MGNLVEAMVCLRSLMPISKQARTHHRLYEIGLFRIVALCDIVRAGSTVPVDEERNNADLPNLR
jgi:hypothetical protein